MPLPLPPPMEGEDGAGAEEIERPIVVGYAFGPKKMSTMGVVMAEASKAQITAAGGQLPLAYRRKGEGEAAAVVADDMEEDEDENEGDLNASMDMEQPEDLNCCSSRGKNDGGDSADTVTGLLNSSGHSRGGGDDGRMIFSLEDHNGGAGLGNIVRHFRSSCSDSESTGTGTGTASTTADSRATGSLPTLVTTRSGASSSSASLGHPTVRVSFVPLDPDQPLEEQHGGRIDIILHKLTEDILFLSQRSSQPQKEQVLSPSEQAAVRRVRRLVEFQTKHRHCCLVDHPDRVQVVMSRADIASKLQVCLKSVTSTSGLPVSSPRYAVVEARDGDRRLAPEQVADCLAGLRYPLIVKPLVAAGTKASHALGILLDPSGLPEVAARAPCLCQEFANHDTVLYKVYVLGDHVSVHRRRSLPNLPTDGPGRKSFVGFDSHRPYPRLRDFGFATADHTTALARKRARQSAAGFASADPPPVVVTVDEVLPLVAALRPAFGLELFGFDVLIADRRRMLVVDVNYFPSYKEVQHFPRLLARYLTDRAIQSRKRAMSAVESGAASASVLGDTAE